MQLTRTIVPAQSPAQENSLKYSLKVMVAAAPVETNAIKPPIGVVKLLA
jgi:hypothetical protein